MLPPSWKGEVEKSVEEAAHANTEQWKTANNKGVAQIAAAIRALRDGQDAQAKKQDKNEKIKRLIDIATIVLVSVTAIFTGLSWWVFRDQLREMEKTFIPIENQAMATTDLVRLAELNAKRQLQPYVLYSKGDISFTSDRSYRVSVTLKNGGQTPAFFVRYWFDSFVGDFVSDPIEELKIIDGFKLGKVRRESTDIGANEALNLGPANFLLNADDYNAIKSGLKAIYVLGHVRFNDIFRGCHFEDFRAIAPAADGPLNILRNVTDGDGISCDME